MEQNLDRKCGLDEMVEVVDLVVEKSEVATYQAIAKEVLGAISRTHHISPIAKS